MIKNLEMKVVSPNLITRVEKEESVVNLGKTDEEKKEFKNEEIILQKQENI